MKQVAKYQLIARDLRQKIIQKDYEINEQLPLETKLMDAYNSSRITVRKALSILENEGLIYKIQGSGTFVRNNSERKFISGQSLDFFDFSLFNVEVFDFSVIKPDKKVAELLNITEFDLVYQIVRLFFKSEKIFASNFVYIPSKIIQGMNLHAIKGSIYDFIKNDLNLSPASAEREIRAIAANEKDAHILGISAGTPLLQVKQRTFLEDGKMFELATTNILSDLQVINESIILQAY